MIVRMSDMMYLFIALDGDGFVARTGDEIVLPNLLRHDALNTGFPGSGAAGHFINHMVDCFAGPFSTPF